jgi:hypothetical protein
MSNVKPLKLSTLAFSKISPQTRKKIPSPIKLEAEKDEKKYKKTFKLWRDKFIKSEDKIVIRDAKLMTETAKIDGILRWIEEKLDHRDGKNKDLLKHIIVALRDTPMKAAWLTTPMGKYQQSLTGGLNTILWRSLYESWIKSMSKEELQKFLLGFSNRNLDKLGPDEFTDKFFQYLHWDDYMNNSYMYEQIEDTSRSRHIDLPRYDTENNPHFPWFIESYIYHLNSDELTNLYNNLYFESNMNNGEAPKEDPRFINNPRYFKRLKNGEALSAARALWRERRAELVSAYRKSAASTKSGKKKKVTKKLRKNGKK